MGTSVVIILMFPYGCNDGRPETANHATHIPHRGRNLNSAANGMGGLSSLGNSLFPGTSQWENDPLDIYAVVK